MASTRLTTFSTILLTLIVRKTAEERQLKLGSHIPTIISINSRIPLNRSSFFQFRQSDPQTQRQSQQIERIRQILRQSSPINKKIWRNLTITITGRELQRNKSRLAQFVRLRKLHGSTASERMQKISNQKNGRSRLQNLKPGQFNSSKKFSLAMKVAATSQLLFLTTAATSPLQDKSKSSFDLANNDLRSSRDELSAKFVQQTLVSTIGISLGKSNDSQTPPLKEQDPAIFQDLQKNSGIVGKVSSQTPKTLEVQTSSTFTAKPSPPIMEHTSSSQSLPSIIGPPGFSPPSDEIIKLLNGAQNFHDLAESMQLKKHLKNATD